MQKDFLFMKKNYFKLALLATAFATTALHAQVSRYTFSQSQETYTPLANPTVVASVATAGNSLDREVFTQQLPFTFSFNGNDYTSVNIYTDGFVSFGAPVNPRAASYHFRPLSNNTPHEGLIAVITNDLEGLNVSGKEGQISVKESGTAPNRIYTIQWKNFTKVQYSGYSSKHYDMNFQLNLHENGVIEKKYNISTFGTPDDYYFGVGLRGATTNDFAIRKAEDIDNPNNWTETTTGTNKYDEIYTDPNTLPPSGLTFTWTPATCLPNFQYGVDGNMITQVIFNTISNTSPFTSGTTPVYEDFTSISTDVNKGATYPISVKGPSGTFPSDVVAYIDFNQNGDFSDAGESFYLGRIQPANPANAHTVTSNIMIPASAMTGATKMRLVKNTNVNALSNPSAPNSITGPCDTNLRAGQVEEYTLNIVGTTPPATSCSPVADFSFDFESLTTAQLFSTSCWNGNYTTFPTVSLTNAAGSNGNIPLPDKAMQIYKGMGITNDITLVTPEVTTKNGTHHLKFDIEVPLAGSPASITGTETIVIGTVTDANDLASFQPVASFPVNAAGSFSTPAITFPAGHTRVAMKFSFGPQPHKALIIDNVKWQDITLATKEINKNDANFLVYPNPASDIVYFQTDKKIGKVEVYNAGGQLVLEGKENQLNIASLPKGMYIVKATLANGEQVAKKLIKK
ncbi:hypothetical protein HMPREF9700_01441 [Bergeyella zoohelcum CCUG 30536]|uniref:Por secretion system C-terminal sorting domain n=2 Tax=Bergeyella zoohelcum TaxID=1015 RepID=A0A380ZYQ5_9FLAO|nr:hypothetical protein HMPREF9700_01441 [Bergeyella zoohelcum CCUG 30536]SUV52690.1 Por secretion system C-terminal sorting domain [Bergeyella zoohelcum]